MSKAGKNWKVSAYSGNFKTSRSRKTVSVGQWHSKKADAKTKEAWRSFMRDRVSVQKVNSISFQFHQRRLVSREERV